MESVTAGSGYNSTVIYFILLQINQFIESVLTNFIKKSNNLYVIKLAPYKNIFYGKYNDANSIP